MGCGPLQSLPDGRGSVSGRDALPNRDCQGANGQRSEKDEH